LEASVIVKCDCGKSLNVSEQHVGKKARCPSCKNVFDILAPLEPLKVTEVEYTHEPQQDPTPRPTVPPSEKSATRTREALPAEKKLFLQVAAALTGFVLLMFLSYTATVVFAALGLLFGLIGCLVQLIRKSPWKPLLALSAGCLVIMIASTLFAQKERNAEEQTEGQKLQQDNQEQYDNAIAAMQAGDHERAIALLADLGGFNSAEAKLKEARRGRWDQMHAGALATLARLEEEVGEAPGTAKKEAEGILKDYYLLLDAYGDYGDVEEGAKSVIDRAEEKLEEARLAEFVQIHAEALVTLARLEKELAEAPRAAKEEAEGILKDYYLLLENKGGYSDVEEKAKSVIARAGIVEAKREADAIEAAEEMVASGKLDEAESSLRKLKVIDPESVRIQESLAKVEQHQGELKNGELHVRAESALGDGRETEALQLLRLVGKEYSKYGEVEAKLNALVETEVKAALSDIESKSRASDWESAYEALSRLGKAQPDHPRIQELEALLQDGLKARDAEKLRLSSVEDGIKQAGDIVADVGLCDTPLKLKNCWANLRQVRKGDRHFRKAKKLVRKLERCRKKSEQHLSEGGVVVRVYQREKFAEIVDTAFLDTGFDVRVKLSGKGSRHLTLTHIQFNRVFLHQNNSSAQDLLAGATTAGFTRVYYKDGFGSSVYYDLSPEDESKIGHTVLEGMGIGEPFRL
jgi:hypothetical protein